MGNRYWIEFLGSNWVVMEDTGYAEFALFSGTHEDCISFIRDLVDSEGSELE